MPRRAARALLVLGFGYGACAPLLPSTTPLGGDERLGLEQPSATASASSASLAVEAPPASTTPPVASSAPPPPSAAPSASAEPSASAAPSTSALATAVRCDMSQGTPGDCQSIRAPSGSNDCYFVYSTIQLCETEKKILQPKVGEKLVSCLTQKSGTDAICKTDVALECSMVALDLACVDERATKTCADIFQRCPPPEELRRWFDARRCAQGVSALKADARAKFEGCLQRSCDVTACLGELM